jgi:hypothetical protein
MPWPFAKFIVESSNGDSVGHQLLIRNVEGHSSDLEVNNTLSVKTLKVTAQNDEEVVGVLQAKYLETARQVHPTSLVPSTKRTLLYFSPSSHKSP